MHDADASYGTLHSASLRTRFWSRCEGLLVITGGLVVFLSVFFIIADFGQEGDLWNSLSWPSLSEPATAQGSVWDQEGGREPRTPTILDPEAVNAQDVCPGYIATEVRNDDLGLTAILKLAGDPCNVYGKDIDTLKLTVQYQSAHRLSINISPFYMDDSNVTQYSIPEVLVPTPRVDADHVTAISKNDFQVEFPDSGDTFEFLIKRISTGDVLFNSAGYKLVFENQFVEFGSSLPKNYNLYGLGEHIHELRLGDNFTSTLFNADIGDPIDYNLYGSHPFYLDTRYFQKTLDGHLTPLTTGDVDDDAEYMSYCHGVFLRNAHAQEIKMGEEGIMWRTIGGSIDLYFFDGPTQAEVTKQYQEGAVGLPTMQQYWTLGYHQSKWGYGSWEQLQEVVDKMKENDIPVETIWSDIDYMQNYRDFTTDKDAFPVEKGQAFMNGLHQKGQHYVPIIDAGIYHPDPKNASDKYETFDRGKELDVFVKNPDGSDFVGKVWPGYTVFTDFLAVNADEFWTNELSLLHQIIPYDGIWIDMNEVASGCNNSCGSGIVTPAIEESRLRRHEGHDEKPDRNLEEPPYVINNVAGEITDATISPNVSHATGHLEYDIHNLYGHSILRATHTALLSIVPEKRPFIIGRSTFAGSGTVAGHWGGDNWAEWYYLYASIPQALTFSLFGIPMFGVDTCGFGYNTTEELCARWMELGAFMPFYRNHNTKKAEGQEPYIWPTVAEASRNAMKTRYMLLPYMYTLLYSAATTGSTVMRALSWEFPNDPRLASADRQFLLGPSLLVTPVLEEGATSVSGVFPGVSNDENDKSGTIWYDWYTGKREEAKPGENKTLDAPLTHIPLHVRGGSVLPLQEPGYTTRDSRNNPWRIVVALDAAENAAGDLYIDDGESPLPTQARTVKFHVGRGDLHVEVEGDSQHQDKIPLASVTVFGVKKWDARAEIAIKVDGKDELNDVSNLTSWDEESGVLKMEGLNDVTATGAWVDGWVLTWT